MKPGALILLGLLLGASSPRAEAADTAIILGLAERPAPSAAPLALTSGEAVTLRLLLPPSSSSRPLSELSTRLLQTAGRVAIPLRAEVALAPDPADPRVTLATFTAPPLRRVTALELQIDALSPIPLLVFPTDATRDDLPSLADALAASRLRLLVCGRSAELRAFLRAQKLDFEDHGADAPDHLPPATLLVGLLAPEDWDRLSAERPENTGPLLAFVADPLGFGGVYASASAPGRPARVKITLPLPPFLPTDPRARDTLHALLLSALAPAQP